MRPTRDHPPVSSQQAGTENARTRNVCGNRPRASRLHVPLPVPSSPDPHTINTHMIAPQRRPRDLEEHVVPAVPRAYQSTAACTCLPGARVGCKWRSHHSTPSSIPPAAACCMRTHADRGRQCGGHAATGASGRGRCPLPPQRALASPAQAQPGAQPGAQQRPARTRSRCTHVVGLAITAWKWSNWLSASATTFLVAARVENICLQAGPAVSRLSSVTSSTHCRPARALASPCARGV